MLVAPGLSPVEPWAWAVVASLLSRVVGRCRWELMVFKISVRVVNLEGRVRLPSFIHTAVLSEHRSIPSASCPGRVYAAQTHKHKWRRAVSCVWSVLLLATYGAGDGAAGHATTHTSAGWRTTCQKHKGRCRCQRFQTSGSCKTFAPSSKRRQAQ